MKHPNTRETINLEEASVLSHEAFAGDQYLLRLQAPMIASTALAGSFVHLRCEDSLPMRRPMSIMRSSQEDGWIDILYKAHGLGTRQLALRKINEKLSVLGPIGVPFKQTGYRPRPLLIGGGVGIPPMVFLSEHIKKTARQISPFVIMGSEVPFPFQSVPSQIMLPGIPHGSIAAMPLLEDWGIASRLSSKQAYPGCFDGYVTDLARTWLDNMDKEQHQNIEIFSCGPTPMLKAVAALAAEYKLPCQVSLEEYMACAVGGCAGCAVRVETGDKVAMKRVCVDGPVFEASTVFPQ
jgi:dihydroorotate dehydrogenase electron transfer subunit